MRSTMKRTKSAMYAICSASVLFQFGGCNFGSVSLPVSLSGQELLIALVRSALVQPIDMFITDTIRNAFDNDE